MEYNRDFTALSPDLSCNILLTGEAASDRTEVFGGCARLGNIAELSVPLIAEEYGVRQGSVGLVVMPWPHPKGSDDPAQLPTPAPRLARAFTGRSAPSGEQRAQVRRAEAKFASKGFLLRTSRPKGASQAA